MELQEAVCMLERGYCLWVGGGLTRKAAASHADVPMWPQVTQEMESAAGLQASCKEDFPTRLERCFNALGESEFESFLRERYYTELSEALLSQAGDCVEDEDFVPDNARALAALGQLANPIVSFNIEPLSSVLLARPAGPVRILFQLPRAKPYYTWGEPGGRFQRLVYHPHGLATIATVMTSGQYEANKQTLAFRLAIHAAFGNTLVIVGMSLEDDYLRQQIQEFRRSLGNIYWFNSQFQEQQAMWARQQDITTVQADWSDFWKLWCALPIDIARSDLCVAWYLAVSEAADEIEGRSLVSLERSLLGRPRADAESNTGKPGEARLISGREPRAIALAVGKRMRDARIPLPILGKTYVPGVTT